MVCERQVWQGRLTALWRCLLRDKFTDGRGRFKMRWLLGENGSEKVQDETVGWVRTVVRRRGTLRT